MMCAVSFIEIPNSAVSAIGLDVTSRTAVFGIILPHRGRFRNAHSRRYQGSTGSGSVGNFTGAVSEYQGAGRSGAAATVIGG